MSTPAPEVGAGLVETLRAARAAHEWPVETDDGLDYSRCTCGARPPYSPGGSGDASWLADHHDAHLARVVQAHVDAAVAAALQSAAAIIERELNCGCVEEFDTTWLQTGSHISCPTAHRAALIVREQIPAEATR